MAKLEDLQASVPEVAIGLSRAGVTGVQKAVRIGRGRREKLIAATIDCTVDLDPSQKGVHMSRFPELFEEAFLVEDLAEHVARRIVQRQGALLAEVRIQARYPYERRTPVTGLSTQEMVSLIGISAASPASRRSGSTHARARRGSCAAKLRTGCSTPGSTPATSSASSSSFRSRPTTSADWERCTSARRRA